MKDLGRPDLRSLRTFPKLLTGLVETRGREISIREKDLGIWQSWTWSEYYAEAHSLANGLADCGLSRGDKLAIIGDNRPELYFGIMATQMLGAVPVPMYQDSIADEMVFIRKGNNQTALGGKSLPHLRKDSGRLVQVLQDLQAHQDIHDTADNWIFLVCLLNIPAPHLKTERPGAIHSLRRHITPPCLEACL